MKQPEPYYEIYVLLDPRDLFVHWVGKSTDATRRYYRGHMSNTDKNPRLKAWLAELEQAGLAPSLLVIKRLYDVVDASALAREEEAEMIANLLALKHPLLNDQNVPRDKDDVDEEDL